MQISREQYVWLRFGQADPEMSAADARRDGAVLMGCGYKQDEDGQYVTNTFALANNIDYPWCDFHPFDPFRSNHVQVNVAHGTVECLVNGVQITVRQLPPNYGRGYLLEGTNSNGTTLENIRVNGKPAVFDGCRFYADVAMAVGARLPIEIFYNAQEERLVRTFDGAGCWNSNVAMLSSVDTYTELSVEYDVRFAYTAAEKERTCKDPFGEYPIGPRPQTQWVDWTSPSAVTNLIWHRHSFVSPYMAYGVRKSLYLSLPSLGGVRISSRKPSTAAASPAERTAVFEPESALEMPVSSNYRFRGADGTTAVFVSEGNIWRFEIYTPRGKLLYAINKWNIGLGEDRCVQKQYSLELPLMSDESVCGTGERFNAVNQRGRQVAFWNTDPTYHWYPTAENLDLWRGYKNVPLIHTGRGCSIFFNTTCNGVMDIGKSDPTRLYARFDDGYVDVYIWAGTIQENLVKYTDLTGKQLLPPEWAFHYQAGGSNGFWKCPDDRTPREVYAATFEGLLEGYRRLGTVPAAIYGEGAVGKSAESYRAAAEFGTRMLCWNCADCPPYVRETVAPDVPAGELPLAKSVFDPQGEPFYFIDFPNEKSAELLDKIHGERIRGGLCGGMVDFAELVPIDAAFSNGLYGNRMHNFFSYWYAKAYNRLYTSLRGDDFLCYIRGGCAGSQQWLCTWCGDQYASFDGLKQQLACGLSISCSGFSVWGGDLAGLCGTPSTEVFLRGLQFSTFQPLMRTGGDSTKQPWDFGEQGVAVYQRHFWLRENLIPLIYSSAVESHRSGLPMTMPMAMAFPREPLVRGSETEYMFCGEILFSPVLCENAQAQAVAFPAGCWYGLFDDTVQQGDRSREIPVTWEYSPAYLRAGAVIPVRLAPSLALMEPFEADEAVSALLITPPDGDRQHRLYSDKETVYTAAAAKTDGGFTVTVSDGEFCFAVLYADAASVICNGAALRRVDSIKALRTQSGYAVVGGKTYLHTDGAYSVLTVYEN